MEKCNWEEQCVKNWDQNRADFEKLPAEEQKRQIDTHVAAAAAAAQANMLFPDAPLQGMPASPGEAAVPYSPPIPDFL